MTAEELKNLSRAIRLGVITLSHHARTAHIGSCLSVVEILAALYGGGMNITPENAQSPDRDRVIFGKGHAAAALLMALSERGFISRDTIFREFNQPGGMFQEHPGPDWGHGVEVAAGSLGHALPIAVGAAMAAVVQKRNYRVCAIMGDGECNEGSVWEAAMFAGGQGKKMAHLAVVVDANNWQAIGRPGKIAALEPQAEKWRAFGWEAIEADGHDAGEIYDIAQRFGHASKPTAVIARTAKGKGIRFMEDDNNWHYRILNDEDLERAMQCLRQ